MIKINKLVESILSNDETSTDEELILHFIVECGLSEEEAKRLVLKRDFYLNNIN